MTVDAAADNDSAASFTNKGSCSDIYAPGVSILGADIGNDSDTQSISGTSMASPHVAGVMAQVLHCNPGASPATVEDIIVAAATPGIIGNAGASPNLMLFNDVCGGDVPPPPPPPPPPPGDDFCLSTNSCGGQAPAGCFCDRFCNFFGDCCPDGPC